MGRRIVRNLGVVVALAVCVPRTSAQQQPFTERVDVARVLVDARVLDDRGRAVPGLDSDDFRVEIDGRPARVDTVEWVGAGRDIQSESTITTPDTSGSPDGLDAPAPRGRLIVLLVQKSLESSRLVGLIRTTHFIDPLFAQLTPEDRIALVLFDTHLEIWSEFTSDAGHIRRLLMNDIVTDRPPPVASGSEPSLVSRVTPEVARRTYPIERALQVIGDALAPLPGSKSVVMLGYGFGRFNASSGSVTLMDGYDEARDALRRARAALFCLDITDADRHSLEIGLQAVAADTGGLFTRTNLFPHIAVERVAQAISGYYVLFVEKPTGSAGAHRISVRLAGRHRTVLARNGYLD